MEENKKPYEFYGGLYYYNFQVEGKNQLQNMLASAKSFARCFNETESIIFFERIFFEPIKIVLEKNPERFRKDQKKRFCLNMPLTSIEFIYYRDGNSPFSKLTKEYPLNVTKPSSRNFMTLDDIGHIAGLIKSIIDDEFNKISNLHNISFGLEMLPKATERGVSNGSNNTN